MTVNFDHILIFKTNIQTDGDRRRIQPILDAQASIRKWNLDLQDVDCVLRIVSETLTPGQIISLVNHTGFKCTELD